MSQKLLLVTSTAREIKYIYTTNEQSDNFGRILKYLFASNFILCEIFVAQESYCICNDMLACEIRKLVFSFMALCYSCLVFYLLGIILISVYDELISFLLCMILNLN